MRQQTVRRAKGLHRFVNRFGTSALIVDARRVSPERYTYDASYLTSTEFL
jgi:hypothetical protein